MLRAAFGWISDKIGRKVSYFLLLKLDRADDSSECYYVL